MTGRECTIKEFRDVIAEASKVMRTKKEHFRLIIEVSGDEKILDSYELKIYDGKKWISTYEGTDLCMLIILIRDAIQAKKQF